MQIHDSVEKKQARSVKAYEPLIPRRPLESVFPKSSVGDMLFVDIAVFIGEVPYIIERSPR